MDLKKLMDAMSDASDEDKAKGKARKASVKKALEIFLPEYASQQMFECTVRWTVNELLMYAFNRMEESPETESARLKVAQLLREVADLIIDNTPTSENNKLYPISAFGALQACKEPE